MAASKSACQVGRAGMVQTGQTLDLAAVVGGVGDGSDRLGVVGGGVGVELVVSGVGWCWSRWRRRRVARLNWGTVVVVPRSNYCVGAAVAFAAAAAQSPVVECVAIN